MEERDSKLLFHYLPATHFVVLFNNIPATFEILTRPLTFFYSALLPRTVMFSHNTVTETLKAGLGKLWSSQAYSGERIQTALECLSVLIKPSKMRELCFVKAVIRERHVTREQQTANSLNTISVISLT